MGGIVDQSFNTGMLLERNKMAMFNESTRREFLVQLGGLGVMLAHRPGIIEAGLGDSN